MANRLYVKALCLLLLGSYFGCGTDGGVPSEHEEDDGLDPIAGLRDDCKQNVRRGLYFLGLPSNRTAGTAFSRYDASTDRFWPLMLVLQDSTARFSNGHTSAGGGSLDPRCNQITDEIYFDGLTASDTVRLDPARYPEGRANIDIAVELRFDAVAFPRSAAEVAVPFDPATDQKIAVSRAAIDVTRMNLVVIHQRPLSSGNSAIIDEQKFPLELACETPFPLEISWQATPAAPVHSLCPRNHAGTAYCLTYDIRHGGGDCRFAIPSFVLDTIQGERAAAGIAGALTRIIENDTQVGMELKVDTIELRAQ